MDLGALKVAEWKRSLSAQYAKVRQQLDLTEKLLYGFSGPKNTGGADLGGQELHKVLALSFWVCSETQGACPAAWDTQWSLCRTGQCRGGVHGLWPKAMTLL